MAGAFLPVRSEALGQRSARLPTSQTLEIGAHQSVETCSLLTRDVAGPAHDLFVN